MALTQIFANQAQTTLAGAITATSLTANLSPGSGALFPSPGANQYFTMIFNDAATGLLYEEVWVTNVTGDTITMIRGQEGSSAKAWNAGDIAFNGMTAGMASQFVQATQAQNNSFLYASDTGASANTYAIALTPSMPTGVDGSIVYFKPAHTNNGASTLTVNGGTSYSLLGSALNPLQGGEVFAGGFAAAMYSATAGAYVLLYCTGTSNEIGVTSITGLTNANVTLTPAQYGLGIITLNGTLTANIQVIFPTNKQQWLVVNNTAGSFTVTCKTAAGTGSTVPQGGLQSFWGDGTNLNQGPGDNRYALSGSGGSKIQSISASVASNALTINYAGGSLDFRSPTLSNGAPISGVVVPSNSITIPSGATLGATNAQPSTLIVVEYYNGGSPVAGVINVAGGTTVDETNLVSPTTISSGATSANTFYSASAVTGPTSYRVVGSVTSTQTTAGTWAAAPSRVQGAGGLALAALGSMGYGQVTLDLKAARTVGNLYYNTSGKAFMLSASFTSNAINAVPILTITQPGAAAVTVYGSGSPGTSGYVFVSAKIPPDASYTIGSSGGSLGTIASWIEG